MNTISRKTTRRYWRRTLTPRPWWPWGIAPLAALCIAFLFGALLIAPRIEAEVRQQVSDRINASGLPIFDVRGDGQGVTISTRAQAEEEIYLQAIAASTRCDTWAGKLPCPSSVDIRRIETRDAPALLQSRPHKFTVEKIEGSVRLSGEVPDLEQHDRIMSVARTRFADITNGLSITNESAGANYGRAADQALAVASHLTSGNASWSGEVLTVNGAADIDAVPAVREQFAAIGNESMQGEFNVRPLISSQQCNSDFGAILSDATIHFKSGSASIDEGNDDLLARLAELASSCPGKLTVQGHTDNQGDASANQALSLARAIAVRDALATRGIEANRMTAKGFGESQPVADNDTAAGRAKNRRIAITIDDMN
jgi:OOP family OmpA-OmpF porin